MFSSVFFELDLLGDRDAVLGDRRRAELLLDDDVAALGAERDLDRVGQHVDAAQDCLAGLLSVHNLLCHCVCSCAGVISG